MRQVVRQPFDVFARLLLEALHFDDVGHQHVIGLTDGLSGHVRRPREPPIRERVQRAADDVAILRHQTLKVLGQFGRAQLKPNEKGRRRAHPRSVVDIRNALWAPGREAGVAAYAAGSLTSIRPSLSRVSNTGCRAVAGPRSIEPSRRLKREPWQGQVTDSPST